MNGATRLAYNAYGDVTGRGTTSGPDATAVYQETFEYDGAGRMWRSNAGDGVTRLHLYDKAGNETMTIASVSTTDLSGSGYATPSGSFVTATGGTTIAGAVATVTVYDKRGMATQTREAGRDYYTAHTIVNGSLVSGSLTNGTITRGKAYNAFGDVISENDARGNATTFTYNTMGRMVSKTLPLVSATSAAGLAADTSPVESYGYDLAGRRVMVTDANGYVTRRTLLAGSGHDGADPLVIKEFHPDTGVVENKYNVFRDALIVKNERGYEEQRGYDKLGQLTSVVRRGALLTDYYSYDLLGQRIRHTNTQLGASYVERTDYDAQGRVTLATDLAGNATTTSYAWDAGKVTTGLGTFGGWVKATTAYGNVLTEVNDLFGRQIGKTDLGGHVFEFTYDKAGQLTERRTRSAAGQAVNAILAMTYFNTGLLKTEQAGQTDWSAGADLKTYGYDIGAHRTVEQYVNTRLVSGTSVTTSYQNAIATYDTHGRLSRLDDRVAASTPQAIIAYDYDKVGNVRKIAATYPNLMAGQAPSQGSVAWYAYDAMNRVTISRGTLSGGAIQRGNGEQISYYADGTRWRVWNSYWHYVDLVSPYDPSHTSNHMWIDTTKVEQFAYRADGALESVANAIGEFGYFDANSSYPVKLEPGTPANVATYTRDAMGRVTFYEEKADHSNVSFSQSTTYGEGQLKLLTISQTDRTRKTAGSGYDETVTKFDYRLNTAIPNYLGELPWNDGTKSHGTFNGQFIGIVTHTRSVTNEADGVAAAEAAAKETENYYDWWDAPLESFIRNYQSKNDSQPPNSQFLRDTAGRITGILRNSGSSQAQVSYVTDLMGRVLRRSETTAGTSATKTEYHYVFDNIVRGQVGNNGAPLPIDYTVAIDQHVRTSDPSYRNGAAFNYANFDQSYSAITPQSGGSGSYTVQDGDTLQSIALQLWGDANLWYKLASANGLTSASALVAGQQLTVPASIVSTGHSASTFKPYDPNEALGFTSPLAPTPKKNACAMVGQLLLIAIAVAVTVWLTGPASGFFTQLIAGQAAVTAGTVGAGAAIAGAAIGGAVAGVAGSVASQAFGLASGLQKGGFNWGAVALAGISGAIGGGLGAFGKIAAKGTQIKGLAGLGKLLSGQGFVGGAARGVISNVATQGIAVATRLQHNFDFAGVAVAGIVGGVSNEIGRALDVDWGGGFSVENAGRQVLTGMAGAVAGATTRSLLTGSDFGDNILAALPDVIGSTIGNIVAGEVASSHRKSVNQKTPESASEKAPAPHLLGASYSFDTRVAGGYSNTPIDFATGSANYYQPQYRPGIYANTSQSAMDWFWSLLGWNTSSSPPVQATTRPAVPASSAVESPVEIVVTGVKAVMSAAKAIGSRIAVGADQMAGRITTSINSVSRSISRSVTRGMARYGEGLAYQGARAQIQTQSAKAAGLRIVNFMNRPGPLGEKTSAQRYYYPSGMMMGPEFVNYENTQLIINVKDARGTEPSTNGDAIGFGIDVASLVPFGTATKAFSFFGKLRPAVSNSERMAEATIAVDRITLAVDQPLLLTYTPTTNTLAQIRRMPFPERWQAGERYVQELYGSTGQQHFAVPAGTIGGEEIVGTGGRFVDASVPTSSGGTLAGEVKTYQQWRTVNGQPTQQFVPLSDGIKQQALKDVWLRQNVEGYDPRWIFLDATPSRELSAYLTQKNIVHVTHR